MPRRKNSAAQPIGPGKKGSLKRAVYDSGGGKKTLRTARSLNKPTRTAAKKYAKGAKGGMKEVVQQYRKVRSATGRLPTSGKTATTKDKQRQTRKRIASTASARTKAEDAVKSSRAGAKTGGPTRKTRTVARIAARRGISRAAANRVRKSRK